MNTGIVPLPRVEQARPGWRAWRAASGRCYAIPHAPLHVMAMTDSPEQLPAAIDAAWPRIVAGTARSRDHRGRPGAWPRPPRPRTPADDRFDRSREEDRYAAMQHA